MRLLIAEDDKRIASFIAKGLRENAYAVDVAADGETALYNLSINSYDAVVLDIMLQIMDGIEVCRELRKLGIEIPVLMLTARDATQDKVTGLDAGADDYLTKPFAFAELLARIRALLRRGRQLRRSNITIDDLEVDTTS